MYKSLNNSDGVAIGMPTSSGKTKIAEIEIINCLIDNPNSLCIYIAPFRSLANEVEYSLSKTLNSMGYILSNLYGSGQSTQIDKQLINESNVIVATPEKIKSILRANSDTVDACREVLATGKIKVLHEVASDGISELMEDKINEMDDESYEQYLKYHYYICEKKEFLGMTNHLLFVGEK